MLPALLDWLQCILLLGMKVTNNVICEETEILVPHRFTTSSALGCLTTSPSFVQLSLPSGPGPTAPYTFTLTPPSSWDLPMAASSPWSRMVGMASPSSLLDWTAALVLSSQHSGCSWPTTPSNSPHTNPYSKPSSMLYIPTLVDLNSPG